MTNILLMDDRHSVASATTVATDTNSVRTALSNHRQERIDELIIGQHLESEALEAAVSTLTEPAEDGAGFDIGVVYVDRQEPEATEVIQKFLDAGIPAEPATISDI